MSRLVLGIGSGCCGTHNLTELLNAQPGCQVGHETGWPVSWHMPSLVDRRMVVSGMLGMLQSEYGGGKFYGDVAMWYLNYIEEFIEVVPDTRVVAIRRSKSQTCRSYLRKMRNDKHWPFNHFDCEEGQIKIEGKPTNHKFFHAFPKYPLLDVEQALPIYWDEYYERVEKLVQRHPEKVKLFFMSQLNKKDGVQEILDFVGLPQKRQVIKLHTKRSPTR